jgi:hypothetical protein
MLRRGPLVAVALAVLAAAIPIRAGASPTATVWPGPTRRARCGPGSLTENPKGLQGRVPLADIQSGRAAKGYTCNTRLVSQFGKTGGFRVHRYRDTHGHDCAFYDTELIFPLNFIQGKSDGTGVWVLDMADPAHPVRTAILRTPAMQSPHESLSLHVGRGLLAADLGSPTTYPSIFDIYDVSEDCRHPVLKSTLPLGVTGHEGAFSPDGHTFWVASPAGTLSAIDVTDPSRPLQVWTGIWHPHGLNISDDGNTLFYGDPLVQPGLHTLDVSQVQRRQPNPQVREISFLRWDNVSLPQVPIPVTIGGRRFLVEVDEFASNGGGLAGISNAPGASVGAGRIIDVADVRHPKIVSNLRLDVHMPEHRAEIQQDPGMSSPGQGYAGHYCAVPRRHEPRIVACSFIISGLRVFDIRDPYHPRELAYFNAPVNNSGGNYALSAPTFVPERGEIWYSDVNEGFFAVRLTNGTAATAFGKEAK